MPLRALYVFTARKRGLLTDVQRGTAPDTLLFGLNHISAHGVQAEFHEPQYGRAGQLVARQVGRLGPDVLQLRTLPRFTQYDVVFLTGAWPLLLAARAVPSSKRPKLVWLNMTLTNLIRRGGPLAALVSLASKQADRIVCVAGFQRKFLHSRLGIPLERLPLVLSGTDAAFYDPSRATALASSGAAVLAAGRDAGRDYATLARASEEAPYRVRVVCSPRNVAGVSLPPNVEVRLDIPQTELRNEYALARAVAVPTQGDGSTLGSDCSGTLVLLDALAMGRPAAITERSSVSDYVTPGSHARIVPAADAPALRRALDELVEGGTAAQELAREGRERVLEALTTRHFASGIAQVLHEVAGSA